MATDLPLFGGCEVTFAGDGEGPQEHSRCDVQHDTENRPIDCHCMALQRRYVFRAITRSNGGRPDVLDSEKG